MVLALCWRNLILVLGLLVLLVKLSERFDLKCEEFSS